MDEGEEEYQEGYEGGNNDSEQHDGGKRKVALNEISEEDEQNSPEYPSRAGLKEDEGVHN